MRLGGNLGSALNAVRRFAADSRCELVVSPFEEGPDNVAYSAKAGRRTSMRRDVIFRRKDKEVLYLAKNSSKSNVSSEPTAAGDSTRRSAKGRQRVDSLNEFDRLSDRTDETVPDRVLVVGGRAAPSSASVAACSKRSIVAMRQERIGAQCKGVACSGWGPISSRKTVFWMLGRHTSGSTRARRAKPPSVSKWREKESPMVVTRQASSMDKHGSTVKSAGLLVRKMTRRRCSERTLFVLMRRVGVLITSATIAKTSEGAYWVLLGCIKGGAMFANVGTVEPWQRLETRYENTGLILKVSSGIFSDIRVFRAPSLN